MNDKKLEEIKKRLEKLHVIARKVEDPELCVNLLCGILDIYHIIYEVESEQFRRDLQSIEREANTTSIS